jgi:hypothetical protein
LVNVILLKFAAKLARSESIFRLQIFWLYSEKTFCIPDAMNGFSGHGWTLATHHAVMPLSRWHRQLAMFLGPTQRR